MLARKSWRHGERDPLFFSSLMLNKLTQLNIKTEYAEIRDPEIWTSDNPVNPIFRAQALIAVTIGDVRLIDNMRLDN